jgi:hypothetical protein
LFLLNKNPGKSRDFSSMIPDRIKQRLVKDRRMTSITLRIPVDVVDSLKELAPKAGHSGYQAPVNVNVQRTFLWGGVAGCSS